MLNKSGVLKQRNNLVNTKNILFTSSSFSPVYHQNLLMIDFFSPVSGNVYALILEQSAAVWLREGSLGVGFVIVVFSPQSSD